jgi:predicted amidophosphoribosyltransferase
MSSLLLGKATVHPLAIHSASLARAAVNVLLPPRCPLCDQFVFPHDMFCADCFRHVGFVTEPCCTICGVMLAHAAQGGSDRVCPTCRMTPPAFSRARAAFRYDAQAKRLILPFKHGDRTELCRVLAMHMMRVGLPLLQNADIVLAVPLHRRRLFQRRYNQAALLARSIARESKVPLLPDGLVRHRSTVPMGSKTALERRDELPAHPVTAHRRQADRAGR